MAINHYAKPNVVVVVSQNSPCSASKNEKLEFPKKFAQAMAAVYVNVPKIGTSEKPQKQGKN